MTHFKSLSLANIGAAIYSLRQQDFSRVEAIIVLDNDSPDAAETLKALIDAQRFSVPVMLLTYKHGDPSKTHAWSTNFAVRQATTPWVLFTRADYLLDFALVRTFMGVIDGQPHGWDGFVTSNGRHGAIDVGDCERLSWRADGLGVLPGVTYDHTAIDAGVWMARRDAFDRVGGLDESLIAWGHAQTHFQHKLYRDGVKFVRVPETLFYHPLHAAPRDLTLAHAQLHASGVDLKELWARYEGTQPYS